MTFGASLLTARAAMRLRRKKTDHAAQERIFAHLLPRLAQASYWKQAGVEDQMTYDLFKRRVPLHSYEDLAPHIAEMKKGAADLLWPGQCQIYALTSGATTGTPRHIPVTEPMLDHFKRFTGEPGHTRGNPQMRGSNRRHLPNFQLVLAVAAIANAQLILRGRGRRFHQPKTRNS